LAALSLAALAASCAQAPADDGHVAMFRADPGHNGVYEAGGVPVLGGVKWKFETGGTVRSSPVLAGDLAYVGSSDGRLYALDRETGRERWSYQANGPINSSPAVAGGAVFFGSRDNTVISLDRLTGELRWQVGTGADMAWEWGGEGWDFFTSSPVIVDGTLVIGSGDGNVYALEAATGAELWRFATAGRVRSSPAVVDGVVYVGSADGRLYAIDFETGEQRWRFDTEGVSLLSADFGYDRKTIQSSPAVVDGTVFVGARDGRLYAVDAGTGSLSWQVDEGPSWVGSSSAISDGVVFTGWSDALILHVVDAATGEERWRFNTGHRVFSSPAIAGDMVYVGNADGFFFAFDKATGEERWRYRVGDAVRSSPVVAGDVVYFGSDDGSVYALEAANGPSPLRAVFWDEGARNFAAYGSGEQHTGVLRYFERWGYQALDSDGLASFMEERLEDGAPSVIVFGMDHVPGAVAPEASDTVLFRRYLDSGGKIVWLGFPPLYILRDSQTGEYTGLDIERPGRLLGVDHGRFRFDPYGVRLTPAGRTWGLTAWWIGLYGVDSNEVTTVLALDEDGGAAAWVKNYGGPDGTGFVQLWFSLDESDLDAIRAVAEYGIMRRE
jgi:outer membrane protein assembly factor BamB